MEYYIRIRGGLGNQMFQYAYTYVLREKFGWGPIFLDARFFKKYYRAFDLYQLNLGKETHICKKRILKYDIPFRLFDFYRFLLIKFFHKRINSLSSVLTNNGFVFGGIASPLPKHLSSQKVYLFGYFQDASILMPYINVFYQIFSYEIKKGSRAETFLHSIQKGNVVISVRINEHDKTERLNYTERDFYYRSLDYLKQRIQINQVIVMSNKLTVIEHERWFNDYADSVLYLSGCSPCEQMEIMKHCENFIISNSTFSWWGAVLGSSVSNGYILAPENWYGEDKLVETKMMIDKITIIQ